MASCENGGVDSAATPVVGIDFGTTNSSVALARHGEVTLASFRTRELATASWRSLLFLERQMALPRKPVSAWTGAEAVEHYLQTDSSEEGTQSRLIQSLKSYLSARDLEGTEIFGRQYAFIELVARILRDLRLRASENFGFEVTRALAGRPVEFVGAETEADNEFALGRLREAFVLAGFAEVQFAMEPVAAAFAYRPEGTGDEVLLVGDFGGGTTDFSLLRVHGSQQGGTPKVLGSTGVGVAGDAFDARIVRRLISPALGSESMARSLGKLLPALPAWVYSNLERWHTLSFLRTHAVRDMLRTAEKRALEPEKIAALRAVVEGDLGYRLHAAVQRLKVDLSLQPEATFELSTEALQLREPVKRTEFEGWIASELQRMEAALDRLLSATGLRAGEVDRVFLTGGTSMVPAVQRVFTERFGAAAVRGGEAFTSVAQGLARMAEAGPHW